nr:LamG domain-containing protein [Arthrobacter pigmenti]
MYYNYRAAIARDAPWAYYPLDEAPTIYVAQDLSGNNRDAAYSYFGVTNSVPGALVNETNLAITLNGTPAATFAPPGPIPGPQTFTVELWFRTGSGLGGELASFGNTRSGTSSRYDRNLYMGSDGKLNFGVYAGATRVITSPLSYNDSAWHHVAATLGPAGMALYVDGRLIGSNSNRAAEAFIGYWRIGGDNLAGWPNRPVNTYFTGSIDEISIYPAALSQARISAHYQAALASTTGNYAVEVIADSPGYFYHLEEGQPGIMADSSGNGRDSSYPVGGVTYNVAGPLVKMNNRAARFDGSSGSLITGTRHDNPQTFTLEAWFNTTTTRGGQIIGFANNTSIANASRHDRTVYMLNSGQLAFGVRPGSRRTIFTQTRYNDGGWHHLAATLSPAGIVLYVDGELAARDTRYTSADPYNGYWQTGAGQLANWPSRPASNYFAGTIDEVAIYTRALTLAQVRAHYSAR